MFIPKNCIGKKLNNPFKSFRKNKKLQVCVKKGNKIHNVHFGDSRYQDYRKHKNKERRRRYLSRSVGIRNKEGKLTKNDKLSPNYWSRKILW